MASVSPTGSLVDLDETPGGGGGGKGKKRGGKVRKESEHKRRLMMNQYFDELVTLLSMVTDTVTTRKMDKTTTLHEAVKLFKLYYDLDNKSDSTSNKKESLNIPPAIGYKPGYLSNGEVAMFLLDSLNAFLMVISENGRILYITDLITSLTGHISSQMVGQLVYDCLHKDDHSLMKKMMEPPDNTSGHLLETSPVICYPPRSFKCRFKIYSTDTSLANSGQVFSCLSYLRQWKENLYTMPPSPSNEVISTSDELIELPPSCLLLIGRLDTDSLTNIDEPIISTETDFNFDMRISKEGKVLDMSQQASLLLGYTSSELVGSLFFDYIDPFHLDAVAKSISTFLSKGLGVSQPFRLATKSTRYLWIIAKGFLSYNPWNHKPDHVLLQCKVLGCDEIPSECRFKPDTFYLPDLRGFESYKPEPVHQQKQVNRSQPKERPSIPHSLPSNRTVLPSNNMSLPSNSMSLPSKNMSLPSKNMSLPSNNMSLPSNSTLLPSNSRPFSSDNMTVLSSSSSNAPPSKEEAPLTSHSRSMEEVCKELERKNQELFEMQCRVLEQQKMIEQERQQFYQITNQVMSYIGSRKEMEAGGGGGSDVLDNISIHPNMALMIRNAPKTLNTGTIGGHMTSAGHMTNTSLMTPGHMTNTGHMTPGHMTNTGHMTPGHMTPGHMTPSHMTNTGQMTPGHMTNTGQMTPGHMTNTGQITPGHMTNTGQMTPGHVTNTGQMTPGHVTNTGQMTPGHMTNTGQMMPGHMTNTGQMMPGHMTPSHMTNTSHMTNAMTPDHMTNFSMLPQYITNPVSSSHMTNPTTTNLHQTPSTNLPQFNTYYTPPSSLHTGGGGSNMFPPSQIASPATASSHNNFQQQDTSFVPTSSSLSPPSLTTSSSSTHCLPLSSNQLSPHQVYRFY